MLKKKKTNLKQNFFKELDATLLQKMKKEMKIYKKGRSVSVNFAKKSLFTTFCFKAKINVEKYVLFLGQE